MATAEGHQGQVTLVLSKSEAEALHTFIDIAIDRVQIDYLVGEAIDDIDRVLLKAVRR